MNDRNAPATKGDLEDVRAELKGDIAGVRTEMGAMEERLIERIHDAQTEILRAFYGFGQSVQNRFKEQDATEASLKQRMTGLEGRIFEIEKRLNLPPNAV
jgi:hypothetical protein